MRLTSVWQRKDSRVRFLRVGTRSSAIKMPRELPGMYFDEERNRYFPLSAKPYIQAKIPTAVKTSTQSAPPTSTDAPGNDNRPPAKRFKRDQLDRRFGGLLRIDERIRHATRARQRDVQCVLYPLWSRILAFLTTNMFGLLFLSFLSGLSMLSFVVRHWRGT